MIVGASVFNHLYRHESMQEQSIMSLHCSFGFPFVCEAVHAYFFGIVAIAIAPAWLGVHVNSAAAQTFNDRWSIIPKAQAEPAPEPLDQTRQDPLAQPPTGEPTLRPGRSLSPSIFQPGVFRKSLLLFISDRENSEWFLVQSGFADRCPSQPAVRNKSSCN